MRVLIVGAGLGGLTLLHGLRAGGIDGRAFERSTHDGAQPASYGIHLNSDGLAALHACLPQENWRRIDEAGVPAPNIIRFRDPKGSILSIIDKRFPEHETDPVTRRRAISRGRLREALELGLEHEEHGEPLIHWGKHFIRYEIIDGGVRAHFSDGTHADGDLIVGADGANSRVRQQRLPQLQREDLGILNIAGRTPLTPALARRLPGDAIDGGINNVVPSPHGWMFFSTWDTGDPDVADYSAGARRYIVWAWAAATSSYPEGATQMSGAELRSLAQRYVTGWDPALRAIVDQTSPEALSTVALRSMPTLSPWSSTSVTLLGDAIHNMTPMAGIGANTALRDADTLRRHLLSTPDTLTDAVGAYEAEMREYANRALNLSTRNARAAALDTPSARDAFRLLLQLGAHVPPLKRKMFGPTRR